MAAHGLTPDQHLEVLRCLDSTDMHLRSRVALTVLPKYAQVVRLDELRTAEDRLTRLTEALGRVIAEVDDGDDLSAGEILAEIKRAGDDLYDTVTEAANQAAALRLAEAVAL